MTPKDFESIWRILPIGRYEYIYCVIVEDIKDEGVKELVTKIQDYKINKSTETYNSNTNKDNSSSIMSSPLHQINGK